MTPSSCESCNSRALVASLGHLIGPLFIGLFGLYCIWF